jgi:hypothetical protein
MDVTALLLSRPQFALTISFHIIFSSFTIGLAAWLTVLEARGSVSLKPGVYVLRRGPFRFPADAALHVRQLPAIPR